jgi:hypothetical protein
LKQRYSASKGSGDQKPNPGQDKLAKLIALSHINLHLSSAMTRLAHLSLPIGLAYSLLFPASTLSQQIAAYNGFGTYSPNFSSGTSPYTIDNGVQCPATTLNATAFGGSANGWTDKHFPPYEAVGGGLGSYGAAVGISVPLGSQDLREWCKSFAKLRKEFETARVQADLLNKCRYLIFSLGINEKSFSDNKDLFIGKEAPLSSFVKCNSFIKLLKSSSNTPNLEMSENTKNAPGLPTDSFSPPPVVAVPSIPQKGNP